MRKKRISVDYSACIPPARRHGRTKLLRPGQLSEWAGTSTDPKFRRKLLRMQQLDADHLRHQIRQGTPPGMQCTRYNEQGLSILLHKTLEYLQGVERRLRRLEGK